MSFVYGSRRGVRASRKLAAGLPPSLYKGPGEISVDFVDTEKTRAGYNEMLDTMCAEVSADPRTRC